MIEAYAEQTLSPFESTLGELMRRDVRTVDAGERIDEAARTMCDGGVGSLVVVEEGRPVGILTKGDLVRRVVAEGLDPQATVRDVITRHLISVEQERPIFDGLLLMIQHDIGHLVVTDHGTLAGIVSERDWLTFQERHPAALLRHFDSADSVAELAGLRAKANRLVRHLFARDGTARALTGLVTEINDRVSRRVIELALAELHREGHGAPPVPFAWLSMGSEGRGEQTLSTDQDNGLVFQDVAEAELEAVQRWFLRLGERVVDGLEVCGFPRCKGNVMASNPELCLPLEGWRHKFAGLVYEADPAALLSVSMFFDFRALYGEQALVDALWNELLQRLEHNRGFLRHMAGHLFEGRPPVNSLGWKLRSRLGMDHPPIDLKMQALGPLVASLRVLALAAGSSRTNTLARIAAAREADLLDEDTAEAVDGAYDYLMLLRIRLHFRQQAREEPPHNRLVFEDLDPLHRSFLTDALQTVHDLQENVYHRYGGISYL